LSDFCVSATQQRECLLLLCFLLVIAIRSGRLSSIAAGRDDMRKSRRRFLSSARYSRLETDEEMRWRELFNHGARNRITAQRSQ
jgi:hypothetical protein